MTRTSAFLNEATKDYDDFSFLEIGVWYGQTLRETRASRCVGVDPNPLVNQSKLPDHAALITLPSDDYFKALDPSERFTGVFADGLHQFEQTFRDVANATNHLKGNGFILIDDVVPSSEAASLPDLKEAMTRAAEEGDFSGYWMGDVYKVVLLLSMSPNPLDYFTFEVEPGFFQTVLIPNEHTTHERLMELFDEQSASLKEESYGSVFASKAPGFLNLIPRSEAITLVRRRLGLE